MAYLQDFYPETTAEVYPAESSDRGSGSSKLVDQPRGVPVFEALVRTLCRLAAIAAAVLVARLTDDESGPISTTAWADSVCTSLSDWRSSINSLAEQLVTELKNLGPPDLEAGKDVEQALDDSAAGLQTSYESLKAGAQAAADADTPAAFLQALAALAPDFQNLLNQIGDTVAVLQSASLFGDASEELERAFADAESCQQLRLRVKNSLSRPGTRAMTSITDATISA